MKPFTHILGYKSPYSFRPAGRGSILLSAATRLQLVNNNPEASTYATYLVDGKIQLPRVPSGTLALAYIQNNGEFGWGRVRLQDWNPVLQAYRAVWPPGNAFNGVNDLNPYAQWEDTEVEWEDITTPGWAWMTGETLRVKGVVEIPNQPWAVKVILTQDPIYLCLARRGRNWWTIGELGWYIWWIVLWERFKIVIMAIILSRF